MYWYLYNYFIQAGVWLCKKCVYLDHFYFFDLHAQVGIYSIHLVY